MKKKAISISQYLNVNQQEFAVTGAFNAILNVDSKLFIDPHLLEVCDIPELENSYEKFLDLFRQIMKLLALSNRKSDPYWRRAYELFNFPEVNGLCIGYSTASTSGSGIGAQLRSQILDTAKAIIDAGVNDPQIFEIMGLFEENIGPDRISDMTAGIIIKDLLNYSQRIYIKELNIAPRLLNQVPYKGIEYYLPRNPFNNWPIILVPKSILRDLPTVDSLSSIAIVKAHNRELRERLNAVIGVTWKEAKKWKKRDYRAAFLAQPELLERFINEYKKLPAKKYNFQTDPAGQFIWYPASREYASRHPLDISLPTVPTVEQVHNVVLTICNKFKDLVENNDLNSLLFRDQKRTQPKHEEAAQKLFYGIADAYCEANNLDLSREPNAGRGPVDFKVSQGYKNRVLVETKLTTNTRLIGGFETQIKEYQSAEKSTSAIYLVIDVGGSRNKISELKELVEEYNSVGYRIPDVIFVNAKPKLSASKMKSKRRRSR